MGTKAIVDASKDKDCGLYSVDSDDGVIKWFSQLVVETVIQPPKKEL